MSERASERTSINVEIHRQNVLLHWQLTPSFQTAFVSFSLRLHLTHIIVICPFLSIFVVCYYYCWFYRVHSLSLFYLCLFHSALAIRICGSFVIVEFSTLINNSLGLLASARYGHLLCPLFNFEFDIVSPSLHILSIPPYPPPLAPCSPHSLRFILFLVIFQSAVGISRCIVRQTLHIDQANRTM